MFIAVFLFLRQTWRTTVILLKKPHHQQWPKGHLSPYLGQSIIFHRAGAYAMTTDALMNNY
jgi:hypothetical protein